MVTDKDPDISIRNKLDFKSICLKEKSKDAEAQFIAELTKHGKTKENNKDEIGNILLKYVFTSL